MKRLKFVHHDGGRADAGFRGKAAGDCVCRAISLASGKPYGEVYVDLAALAKRERVGCRKRGISNPRAGVYKNTYHRYILSLGGVWTPVMQIGKGCTMHMRADELPRGFLILSLSRHLCAVIDHVIYDLYSWVDREGNRCVYGYYTFPRRHFRLP